MSRTICYKVKSGETFLAYYTNSTIERAKEAARRLNEERPMYDGVGCKIDWNNVDYFFANEQEEMY